MKLNKNLLYLLIVNFLIFSLTIVLIEGLFRFIGIPYKVGYIPSENSFAVFDTQLGWSYMPNKSTIHESGDGKIRVPVYFDKNGIRVQHPDAQLNSIQPSVLFIGGSFTMGHGLSYEESFVGKFEALDEIKYQIVNLGVQGYGSDQALLALKKYLHKFNAKVVVYTFIEDHILRNGNYDRRMLIPIARFLGTKPKFELTNSGELYLAKKPLLYKDYPHSYLIDYLKMRIGTMLGHFPPYPEKLTMSIIREMKKYSNEHGANFVILNWRWSTKDYERLLQELDIDVIDTMQDAPDNWAERVLLEGIHPSAQAGDHAALLLLNYFYKKGLVQNKSKK